MKIRGKKGVMVPLWLRAGLCAILLGGCSTQQMYVTAQEMQKMECRKMPADARDSCLRSSSMSYDKYEQERARTQRTSD